MDTIEKQVKIYNKYSSNTMIVTEIVEEYFTLRINGDVITKDDYNGVYDRIRGINRENGYTHLEEW